MTSDVYFWNLRTTRKATYEKRLTKLLKSVGAADRISSGDLIAVKIHFGEKGVTEFIHPIWVKPIVSFLRKAGGKPFLTDTNTLYIGERGESVSHALIAAEHGFDPNILGAPVIIADGLKSNNEVRVPFKGKRISEAYLAGDIVKADCLVNLAHFKGHIMAGFGGAIKNLAMGCATRTGKMHQHSGLLAPAFNSEHCEGCGLCVAECKGAALTLDENKKAVMDVGKCIGCAACILACRNKCFEVDWKTEIEAFTERMVEYAAAVVKAMPKPTVHVNFALGVTPNCDCEGFSDAPLCHNIGVLASLDPVALDQACLDLVNNAQAVHASALPQDFRQGSDKFLAIHPHVRHLHGLDYAESIGLGSKKYRLLEI